MRKSVVLRGVLALFVLVFAAHPSVQAEPMEAGKAFTKLTRGFVNLITGWVEIPKRIHETTQTSGAAAGFTWGLLRGLGRGFIRTAAGAYEFVTFPFPAPPGYEPVIQPEYVFTESAPESVE
jgi:putative exosortase-associated protein (TIGR04073 family)